jgi:hypothetical protein
MLEKLPREWFGSPRADLLAGLVVALALIPEAIAFSLVAGVDPKRVRVQVAGLNAASAAPVSALGVHDKPHASQPVVGHQEPTWKEKASLRA